MSKDVYYFSHDANARHDPKICALINKYRLEGYGRFWVVVEMLRNEDRYQLPLKPYVFDALAMQMQCDVSCAHDFIQQCIEVFELFKTDDSGYFWSDSLRRRMEEKDARTAQARKAAELRWGKQKSDAGAMQQQCGSNAIKESKANKSKGKEIGDAPPPPPKGPPKQKKELEKKSYAEFVAMTEDEHSKLVARFGEADTAWMIEKLDNHKGAGGQKYKSDYRAILKWVVGALEEERNKRGGGPHGPAPPGLFPTSSYPPDDPRVPF